MDSKQLHTNIHIHLQTAAFVIFFFFNGNSLMLYWISHCILNIVSETDMYMYCLQNQATIDSF